MRLKNLIAKLRACPGHKIVRIRRYGEEGYGLGPESDEPVADTKGASPGNLHSYRGYYERLAIDPKAFNEKDDNPDCCVSELIERLEGAIGKTFQGWKGGDYTMDETSLVHVAIRGYSNDDYIIGVENRDDEVTIVVAAIEDW